MINKPRVFFDGNPIIGHNKSGIGYLTLNLINNIIKTNKINLVGFYFDFLGKNKYNIQNVINKPIKIIPGRVDSLVSRLTGLQLPIEFLVPGIRKNDWVVYPNYSTHPSILKTKSIVFIHDLAFLDLPNTIDFNNLKFLKKIVPKSIKRANKIICISNFTKKRLLHHYPEINQDNVIVIGIPHSNYINPINNSALNKFNLNTRKFILHIGTIEPRKNIQQLVDAYTLLPDSIRKQYSLVLAGGVGWKVKDVIESIDKYNCKNEKNPIVLTGYISDDEKDCLYRHASLFVIPSLYEGFGMPLTEAMSYKLPCIANNIEVFREIASDTVNYFNNTEELKKIITKKLKTPFKEVNYKRILNKYNWNNFSSNIIDIVNNKYSK